MAYAKARGTELEQDNTLPRESAIPRITGDTISTNSGAETTCLRVALTPALDSLEILHSEQTNVVASGVLVLAGFVRRFHQFGIAVWVFMLSIFLKCAGSPWVQH